MSEQRQWWVFSEEPEPRHKHLVHSEDIRYAFCGLTVMGGGKFSMGSEMPEPKCPVCESKEPQP